MHNELTRISQTLLKSVDGFRAALDGLDLPTLIQILCARKVRLVLRIASGEQEGFLYFDAGRLVHAEAEGRTGEAALCALLAWESGETTPCERAFPDEPSLTGSVESQLLRAAHVHDENNRGVRREETGVTKTRDTSRRFEVLAGEGGRRAQEPPPLPLPREPLPATRASKEAAVRASVRVSPNGELLSVEGDVEMFGELVAYVMRLGVVLGAELALEPFESLHAELGGDRLVVFSDGADTVGLLLRAGAAAHELRRQLGH